MISRPIAAFLPLLLLAACAAPPAPPDQNVRVETYAGAYEVTGARCTVRNDLGEWPTVTPGTVNFLGSHADLVVNCEKAGYRMPNEQEAKAGQAIVKKFDTPSRRTAILTAPLL